MTRSSSEGGEGVRFVHIAEVPFNHSVKVQRRDQFRIVRPVVGFLNSQRSLAKMLGIGIFALAHFQFGKLHQGACNMLAVRINGLLSRHAVTRPIAVISHIREVK